MPRMIGSGLSRREREIIEALHRLKKATAGEIQAALPDTLSNSAVRTMLRILEDKGHVQHHEDGRRYVYVACEPRPQAARAALQNVVWAFFGGDSANAVYALLNKSDQPLSDENFEEKIHQLTVRVREIHQEHTEEEKRQRASAAIQAAFESLRNQTSSDTELDAKLQQMAASFRQTYQEQRSEDDLKRMAATIQTVFESLQDQTGDEEEEQK